MTTKFSKKEKESSREYLQSIIKPGDTIYCILRHVSRSGMYRAISLFYVSDNQMSDISYHAARLLEGWDDNHYACRASGCGMDMGFALVYNLSWALFPDGFDCIGDGCPSNNHSNSPYPLRIAGSMHHKEAGYALKCQWM